MFVTTQFKETSNTKYTDLFSAIDTKVAKIAKYKLDNIRYGFNNNVNYQDYEDLMEYRDILQTIMYCSDCLCDVNIDVVLTQIRKLTNKIC